MQNPEKVQIAAQAVRAALPQGFCPRVGIVLGTGLGALANAVTSPVAIPYESLPGFPRSTVASHAGSFLCGFLGGAPVVLQQGRCHLYEGYQPEDVCMGVRVMAALGAATLVITNAAGALNPQFDAGDLMCITDHINFTGRTPLAGPNHDAWGPRFPDMSAPYAPGLVQLAMREAGQLGIRLERGVYVGVHGPQMETPAETRMFRTLGADAVGMSTVLEVIAARHLGMKVLGISCLSNKNLPDCMEEAPLEEVIRVAGMAGERLTRLVAAIVPHI
ncbi:purine-nucleoside phosphorylase [Nitratidesulfovibrio vulgaris]|uniref:purine-nucleoside phosphorylase n=1 Tax=Nitratidesulfovibrio vulgaris TaxID=881 RepID=UPI002300497B|nr:purine-nucleoside phosphorylase [Nitratidesulfovibrio vulgaris]WCB45769.1 purine-nucleoside phosphorylase [Nitratidesulfovibrio vulgaris]